jgi:hypothetical protein
VYRAGPDILKVPRKTDFDDWLRCGVTPEEFLSRIPEPLTKSYLSRLPLTSVGNDRQVCYAVWNAYQKSWTYTRLSRAFAGTPCGIPTVDVLFGEKRWGFFGGSSMVAIIRQSFVRGPSLQEMLQRSEYQDHPSAVLYELKPEFQVFRTVITATLRHYVEKFGERRARRGPVQSYRDWFLHTFPLGSAGLLTEPPILDMNPSNFLFDVEQRRPWYVDVDPHGMFQSAANHSNQDTLCAFMGS